VEKSVVRNLPDEKFTFVGFRFILEIRHGKSKVYNIAPPEKLTIVKAKIVSILSLQPGRRFRRHLLFSPVTCPS